MIANHGLVEDIREYWSHRAETFDRAFGHGIAPGQEAAAWARPQRKRRRKGGGVKDRSSASATPRSSRSAAIPRKVRAA